MICEDIKLSNKIDCQHFSSWNYKSIKFLSKKIGYTLYDKPLKLSNSIFKLYILEKIKKMREKIITDFLNYNKDDNSPKKYLELPVFDKKFNLKKNIIFYKDWNNCQKKKITDIKENLRLYNYFLNQLTVFLNNHHKKEHSKRYWSIILGPWLWRFISAMSFKWNLIHSIKKICIS